MPVHFENIAPILRVSDMKASLDYYVRALGFAKEPWCDEQSSFAMVTRDGHGIYFSLNDQGHAGTWVWIGVEDVERLFEQYKASGARIRGGLENYSWALEMRVEDPDGHVLRFASDAKTDRPFKDKP
jgi:uncharacterized glyoxalase superfamily protein PhnB